MSASSERNTRQGGVSQPVLSLSSKWLLLGPFQIGTREATWGADPLEQHGGFRNLSYDREATFVSSLAPIAQVKWSTLDTLNRSADGAFTEIDFSARFDDIDWSELRGIYGWAALQYQAWARGHIEINAESPQTVTLQIDGILEFYVGKEHYFGGDFYSFGKAPVVLTLPPGRHRLDLRLIRDVRSMGGTGIPTIDLHIKAELSTPRLHVLSKHSIFPDIVDGRLSSPYASVSVRNSNSAVVEIVRVVNNDDGAISISAYDLIKSVQPGQTRSISLHLSSAAVFPPILNLTVVVREPGTQKTYEVKLPAIKLDQRSLQDMFRLTYRQPSGTVYYTMLRAPQISPKQSSMTKDVLPTLLNFHGAGLDADNPEMVRSLNGAGDLPAFVLFPTGGSSWSGDDWHQNGTTHVLSSISALEEWAKSGSWTGPRPDTDRWFVIGHSNGGQGTWQFLTHHPDRIIAAAPVAGYLSIQNYVPYQFWHPMDPAIKAILEGSLLDYRHELFIENAKGVPLFQQHGDADTNVPVYHSRLMRQLATEAKIDGEYNEVPGAEHWFDGIMTTHPLVKFYHKHLESAETTNRYTLPVTVISSRPQSFSSVHGFNITALKVPGHLARLTIDEDKVNGGCSVRTQNVAAFEIHGWHRQCKKWRVDSSFTTEAAEESGGVGFRLIDGTWHTSSPAHGQNDTSPGGMDAFLRAAEPVRIVRTTPDSALSHVALQISRNLYQYFGLDSDITNDMVSGRSSSVVLGIGGHIAIPTGRETAERRDHDGWEMVNPSTKSEVTTGISITDEEGTRHIYTDEHGPIGAIFLTQPVELHGSPGLRIWGSDAEGLAMAARLLPMIPGGSQPDFIVTSRATMVKGASGSLAMGFFKGSESSKNSPWEVSTNSYFT